MARRIGTLSDERSVKFQVHGYELSMSPNSRNIGFGSYQNCHVSTDNLSFDGGDIERNDTSSTLECFQRLDARSNWQICRTAFFVILTICMVCLITSFPATTSNGRYDIFHGVKIVNANDTKTLIDGIPKLIWSDEFDGDSLDLTKWSFVNGNGCDVGLCGWGKKRVIVFGIFSYYVHYIRAHSGYYQF